jgi:hypothetical protein
MISSSTLITKLKLQSELLAKSLNLPKSFGYDLLATSIYQHFDFNELCDSISELDYTLNFTSLAAYQKLKYLLICEVEDKELIDDLHKEIENMALRLEERTVINISNIHTISNIYKLFGLDNESKYIVDVEHFKLNWQPCFDSLHDQQAVLNSDFLINEIPFRLIATKVQFDEYSVDNFKHSLNKNLAQIDDPSLKNRQEKLQINKHFDWLVDSYNCLTNVESDNPDQHPIPYTINNKNYLVYGFPLSPHLSNFSNNICTDINIRIKDTVEKQVFILNFEVRKLTLECHFLNKIEKNDCDFSQKNQWIKDTLLARDDVCAFPVIFNNAYYLLILRPFLHIDWLENAL